MNPQTALRVARIVPDVTGLDKHFDYLVPADWQIEVGDLVRAELHGRRIGGWVIELDPDERVEGLALRRLARWSSRGPDAALLELAEWASERWAACRLRPFLKVASPPRMVRAERVGAPAVEMMAVSAGEHGQADVEIVRLAPTADPLPIVLDATAAGRSLVLHPSPRAAAALTRRLCAAGRRAVLWPDEWSAAAFDTRVEIVVGSRAAAWARTGQLAAVVVLDEHDEAYHEERAPTWNARDVVVERARRCAARCTLVSAFPTAMARSLGPLRVHGGLATERDGWPVIELVDRSEDPPWQRSLLTSRLIAELRDTQRRVVCVTNTPGRARRLACRACRALIRCAACAGAVVQADDGVLQCPTCAAQRPPVCQACGSSALANIRPGVTRLAEELAAAAGRNVVTITAASEAPPDPAAGVYVGTEAALHRLGRVDTVAFLDIDAELLAPRYRADEQAMALLIRAARLVGDRRHGGRVLVHTRLPEHPVLGAAVHVDLHRLAAVEDARRAQLQLPPTMALARLEGADAAAVGEAAAGHDAEVSVGRIGEQVLARAPGWEQLGSALCVGRAAIATARAARPDLRIEVDPAR